MNGQLMPVAAPPDRDLVMRALDQAQALVRKSHFVYAAGDHGPDYFNKDAIVDAWLVAAIAFHMAAQIPRTGDVVIVGAAVGAIRWAQAVGDAVARMSSEPNRRIIAMYADKVHDGEESPFVFKRGYGARLRAGGRRYGVEDVFNSGGSAGRLVQAMQAEGVEVEGLLGICNRGRVTKEQLGVNRLWSFIDFDLPKYLVSKGEPCPLCEQGVPVNVELGHGADWVKRNGQVVVST